MRKTVYIVLLVIVICTSHMGSAESKYKVYEIKLIGLNYLQKQEVLDTTVTVDKGEIYVDIAALDALLRTHPMIESYSVQIKNNVCIVTIKEKSVIASIVIERDTKEAVFFIDKNMKIVPSNRIYATDRPIIKIDDVEIAKSKLSHRVTHIITTLQRIMNSNYALFKNIVMIQCMHPNFSIIRFRDSRIVCQWDETYESLKLLAYVFSIVNVHNSTPLRAIATSKRIVVW